MTLLLHILAVEVQQFVPDLLFGDWHRLKIVQCLTQFVVELDIILDCLAVFGLFAMLNCIVFETGSGTDHARMVAGAELRIGRCQIAAALTHRGHFGSLAGRLRVQSSPVRSAVVKR